MRYRVDIFHPEQFTWPVSNTRFAIDFIFLQFPSAPMGGHHMNNEINICLIQESFSHPPEIHPAYPIKQGGAIKARDSHCRHIFALCNAVCIIAYLHCAMLGGVAEIRSSNCQSSLSIILNTAEYNSKVVLYYKVRISII